MLASLSALALSLGAGAFLWRKGRAEHRAILDWRAGLLDEAAALFPGSRITSGPDGFPQLSAALADGSAIRIELLADTLVTRRLPQLWLMLSIGAPCPERPFSAAALARPTGAEFYALTHGMPDWHEPPPGLPLLCRGKGASPGEETRARNTFAVLFGDPLLKEAAATPKSVRVVRQVAQGERAAHLLLRQSRFPLDAVPVESVRTALADAQRLRRALSTVAVALAEAA